MRKLLGLVIGLWICGVATLHAVPKIDGGFTYEFGPGKTTVTISVDAIVNSNEERGTGSIMVQLWAMDAQYDGGRMRGHAVASQKLSPVGAGGQYSDYRQTLKAYMPARAGNYHMCLTISEYRGDGYVITDSRNFSRIIALAPAAPAKVTLSGSWSWTRNREEGTVDIQVDKITNRKSGRSGSLRLAVWATPRPYTGGRMGTGYQLGFIDKKALEKGYIYNDVYGTSRFKRPAPGTYHTCLLLLEFNGEEYVIVGHMNSSRTTTF